MDTIHGRFRQTSLSIYLDDNTGEMVIVDSNAIFQSRLVANLYIKQDVARDVLNRLTNFYDTHTNDEIIAANTTHNTPTPETVVIGHVYLLRNSSGLHKIGYTTRSVKQRAATIAREIKQIVNIIDSVKVENPDTVESLLHIAYAKQNVRGEWFDLSPYDVAAIRDYFHEVAS